MGILSLPRKLLLVRRLRAEERRDLFAAQWALLEASWAVKRRPTGELVAVDAGVGGAPNPGRVHDSARVAMAVTRVSKHGPFEYSCLVRSLAIQRMLRARGLDPGRIRIGVREGDDGFEAHAWVEQGERVLGDTAEHVATFETVTDMTGVRF